jgi:hypothetical protein
MTFNAITPTKEVRAAVDKVLAHLLGEEAQVFYSEEGALVLTDQAAYEVYTYGRVNDDDHIIIQRGTLERATGWEDISTEVL